MYILRAGVGVVSPSGHTAWHNVAALGGGATLQIIWDGCETEYWNKPSFGCTLLLDGVSEVVQFANFNCLEDIGVKLNGPCLIASMVLRSTLYDMYISY